MFELALRSALSTNLLTGYGYLGFYYLMEMGRADIATYAAGMTYFVHNDYLQVFLELGVPGLVLLLSIVLWPLAKAWQVAPRASSGEDRITLVALAAMLASMAVHATVDYPFYVPVCLLIYGIGLGMLDSLLLARGWTRSWRLSLERAPASLGRAARAAAVTLMAFVLVMPVAAEAAAAYAHKSWRDGRGQDAAYWFGIARTLQPRDWRYHWYEGQFWFAQAAQQRKPGPAALADKAFAAGVAANPREPRNLVGRLSTQLELTPLLEAPVDASTLMAWANRVMEQAPNDPSARKVRAAVVARLQARERAGR